MDLEIVLTKRDAATQVDFYNLNNALYRSEVIKEDVVIKTHQALTNSPYIELVGTGIEIKIDEIKNQTFANIFAMRDYLISNSFFNGKARVRSKGSGKFDADKPNCNIVDPDIKATDTIRISTAQDVDETFTVTAIADGTFTANRTVAGLNSLSQNATFTWYIE